ncbi:OstA-like protein [Galbibacter sp. EGI 63066]|uniref:OstA-like protein n=1 Tax=Galbibacter sp. EGI 63066 TaxID=2993559 RepID=UPI0022488DF7|nr:OstA-like protein [Galbibacter sp. EGI 63066]MCX2678471.1 OstA-like protein [Galbibacter sp. EGI 63066]
MLLNNLFKYICLILVVTSSTVYAQEKKEITIVHGGDFNKDENKYPGAAIFSKDDRQVQFEHQGIDLWCDLAIYYQEDNRIKAHGNVFFQQGDSIKMNSEYVEYDGTTKIAIAKEKVVLRNNNMTLTTEELELDRNTQEAYYDNFGTVKDSVNVLTSNRGRFYMEIDKYEFKSDVKITNPDYVINSARMDYYTGTKNAYMYGPSTVTGEDYKMYCERGYYNTTDETGYGVKNTRIDYSDRIIYGDSLYFDKATEFASATNNIKVIDTVNNGVLRGHYAEVYKAKDSVLVTKRAVAVSLFEKDSMYIHADTLMVTGKENERVIRGYRDARFYKTDLSGKSDSIHSSEKTGVTQLITTIPQNIPENKIPAYQPILWSGETQMTGDSIHIISDMETEKIDSLKVWESAFIIQKDSLSGVKFKDSLKQGYNQIKGKSLYGLFEENELRVVDIVKNAELIYYLWNDNDEFVGIDKRKCGLIQMTLENDEIDNTTSFINVEGNIYPDDELPVNGRKFRGFYWRGDEMIRSKEDLYSEEDNNLELPVIKGVNNPIDLDNPNLAPKEETIEKPEKEKPKPKETTSKAKATVPKKSSKEEAKQ